MLLKLVLESTLFQLIFQAAAQMHWSEILAVLFNLIYLIFAMRENRWCWPFGIIASVLSIYLFFISKLYAESILYFYYVLAGIYGWYTWGNRYKEKELPISTWSFEQHARVLAIGFVLSALLAFILQQFTDAQMALVDAHTTIFSFIATYMVTQKILENWIYWIIIDMITIGLYISRELYLYALLMVLFTIMAVWGYRAWKVRYSSLS
ncbi:MAG: nicotinamide riboside transporter PnuC [Bacteroidota bacterium]